MCSCVSICVHARLCLFYVCLCVCARGGGSDQPPAGTCTKREYPICLLPRALGKHDYTLYSYYHDHRFSKLYQHQKKGGGGVEETGNGGGQTGEERRGGGEGVEGER